MLDRALERYGVETALVLYPRKRHVLQASWPPRGL